MARKTSGAGTGSETAGNGWGKLQIERRRGDPRTLQRQDVNARYMDKQTFDRLVENVRTDGQLTGSVLCYQPDGDGDIEILSGHHRRDAAIEAEVFDIELLVITTPLSLERKRAIQLSHNSLVGRDDLGVLSEMYEALDIEAKRFSGLTDDFFSGLDKIDLSGLGSGSVEYQDLTFHFLPENLGEFEDLLKRVARSKRVQHIAARYEDFDRVFDAIVRVKLKLDIRNSALALLVMAELACERLDQMEDEQDDEDGDDRKADEPEAEEAGELSDDSDEQRTEQDSKPKRRRKTRG